MESIGRADWPDSAQVGLLLFVEFWFNISGVGKGGTG